MSHVLVLGFSCGIDHQNEVEIGIGYVGGLMEFIVSGGTGNEGRERGEEWRVGMIGLTTMRGGWTV